MKVVQQPTGLTKALPGGPAYLTGELLNTPQISQTFQDKSHTMIKLPFKTR